MLKIYEKEPNLYSDRGGLLFFFQTVAFVYETLWLQIPASFQIN